MIVGNKLLNNLKAVRRRAVDADSWIATAIQLQQSPIASVSLGRSKESSRFKERLKMFPPTGKNEERISSFVMSYQLEAHQIPKDFCSGQTILPNSFRFDGTPLTDGASTDSSEREPVLHFIPC